MSNSGFFELQLICDTEAELNKAISYDFFLTSEKDSLDSFVDPKTCGELDIFSLSSLYFPET